MKNIYLRDPNNCVKPVYVGGESYSFYINFQTPINDPNLASFKLNILKANSLVSVANNIGILKAHNLENGFYNIYCEFDFPNFIPNGEYVFQIFDSSANFEKAKSNIFLAENQVFDLITQRVEFSNELNLDRFYYETLPEFRNKFRVQISKIDVQFPTEKNQYRNVTNKKKLRTISSYRDKVVKVEAYYYDEEAHEAMAHVVDCQTLYIDGVKYVPKTGYTVTGNQMAKLTKGEFDAIEDADQIIQTKPIATLVLNQPPLMKVGFSPNLTGTVSLSKGQATAYDFYMIGFQEPNQPQQSNVHDYGAYGYGIPGLNEAKVIVFYVLDATTGQAIATSTIEGVFPLFATTVDVQTNTEQPLYSMIKGNNIEIMLSPETNGDKQHFDIPIVWIGNRPLVKVLYFVNHLGRFEDINKIAEFTISDVVNVVSGNNTQYKRYTNNTVDRGSILIKLIF